MKIRFKKRKEQQNLAFVEREKPDDVSENSPHFYFNFVLYNSGIKIKGNNSGNHYMQNKMKFRRGEDKCVHLANPEKAYYNEIFYSSDWIVEYKDYKDYLLNPMISDTRFVDVSYDEIKRKGFRIVSRKIRAGLKVYKQQRVFYFLHHITRTFPPNSILMNVKPPEVTIRLDQKRNMIRLDGPNVIGPWRYFINH